VLLCGWGAPVLGAVTGPASLELTFHQEGIVLNARESPLSTIVDKIQGDLRVEIRGLNTRGGERITFSCKARTTERFLKLLLRHLGERNYIFEYKNNNVVRVAVFPKGKAQGGGMQAAVARPAAPMKEEPEAAEQEPAAAEQEPAAAEEEPAPAREAVEIVEIQSVLDDSQARAAGLQKGDYIVEYGGAPLRSAQQLLGQVKDKAESEEVEITLLREGRPVRTVLKGGFIGVQVKTVRVFKDEFEEWFPKE